MVSPCPESRRICVRTRSRSPDPIPAVGSSRSSRRGPVASARAISSSLRSPCDSSAAGRRARSARPTSASSCRARPCTSLMPRNERSATSAVPSFARSGTATFSSAVSCGKMFVTWNVRAMPARTRALVGIRVTSAPSNSTLPASGSSFPLTRLMSVVLPAPFGPITAVMPPAGRARSTPSTAMKSANALRTRRSSSSAVKRRPPGAALPTMDAAPARPRRIRAGRRGTPGRRRGAPGRRREANTR